MHKNSDGFRLLSRKILEDSVPPTTGLVTIFNESFVAGLGVMPWYISTSITPPSPTDLVLGNGSEDFGNINVVVGVNTITPNVTLTEGQTYWVHYIDPADSSIGTTEFTVPDTTAPTVTFPILTRVTDTSLAFGFNTTEGTGEFEWVLTTDITKPTEQQIIDGQDHTGALATRFGTQAVTQTGAQVLASNLTGLSFDTYYFHLFHRDGSGNVSDIETSNAVTLEDTSLPVLNSISIFATSSTEATVLADTPVTSGTLYVTVVETSAPDPGEAAILAGPSQPITASGVQIYLESGLTPGTEYTAFAIVNNGTNNSIIYETPIPATTPGGSLSLTDQVLALNPEAMYNGRDLSTVFTTDTGSTNVANNNDQIGRIEDISGNGQHLVQPNASQRPIYDASDGSAYFDGNDDDIGFTFAGGAGPDDVTVFAALKTNDATGLLFNPTSGFFGWWSGGLGQSFTGVGANARDYLDNNSFNTRNELNAALVDGLYHVFEGRRVELSTSTEFEIASNSSNRPEMNLEMRIVILDQAVAAANRDLIVEWLLEDLTLTLSQQVQALLGNLDEAYFWDASIPTTVWQDTAGTTPAVTGDPVGRIDDLGKHGMNMLQSTAAQRPILQSDNSILFDGVDDDIGGTFGANPRPSDCSVFVALTVNSTISAIFSENNQGSRFLGLYRNDTAQPTRAQAGASAENYVNGVNVINAANALYNALTASSGYALVEFRNVDLNTIPWSDLTLSGYTGSIYNLHDNIGPRIAVVPAATADANRALLEAWVMEPHTFDPVSLFSSGETGTAIQIAPEYCFTDTAGTTQAAVGDPVARINALNGGRTYTQATVSQQAILRQDSNSNYYLEFDGVDDEYFSDQTVEVNAGSYVNVAMGTRAIGSIANRVWSTASGRTSPRVQGLWIRTSGEERYFYSLRADITAIASSPLHTVPFDGTPLLVQGYGTDAGVLHAQVNNDPEGTIANASNVTYNEANRIGGVDNFMNFYGGVYIDRELTTQEISDVRAWTAALANITI